MSSHSKQVCTSPVLMQPRLIALTLCYASSFLSTVNCSGPTSPINGSIDPHLNTTEGAEIFFRCNPGFVPAGRMRAACTTDGRWNPEPAGLVCICGLK